ncbi:mechanosensitive ion channel family protein [Candidatus Gracilibacteria bacterium]|nr:mechanosensitive ion channel family protein [Candidatus Gracilibacteria bacterium]
MKRIIFSFLLLLLFVPVAEGSISLSSAPSDNAKGEFRVLLKGYRDLQDLKHTLVEKNIALGFERSLTFPSLVEIDKIDRELAVKFLDLESLQDTMGEDYEGIYVLDEQILDLKQRRQEFEKTYENRKGRQQENILELIKDVDDVKEEIEKQRQLIRKQISSLFAKFGVFFAVIILLLVLKIFVSFLLKKSSSKYSEKRQNTLQHLNKVFFNILIALVLIGVLTSQVVNVLPFIAIFGTGLAFAVRDSISSFIGWFVIGSERGYKVGNVIRVKHVTGKVYDIGALVTVVQDLTAGKSNGTFVSFPNKIVFEEEIVNLSKNFHWVKTNVYFLVSPDSNLEKAEDLLKKVIEDKNKVANKEFKSIEKKLIQNLRMTEKEVKTNFFWESTSQGLRVTASFWSVLEEAEILSSEITKNFIEYTQKHKDIVLMTGHFSDNGSSSKKPKAHEEHLH